MLLGGTGRFIPGRVGANHGWLWHTGGEKRGHGLTCRTRETSGEGFLDDLLQLFGYPGKSGAALLDGSLKLNYCIVFVSRKRPTRGLVQRGRVADLLGVGGGRWVVLQLSLSSGCPTIGGSLEAGGFWKRAWPFRAANPR